MRITTHMLNMSMMKSGIPIQTRSLLDYLNGSASDNTLLASLSKTGSEKSVLSQKNYQKLKDAADDLEDQTEALTAEGRDSVFEKLKEDGDRKTLDKTVDNLVSNYNSTMDALKTAGGTMNTYYYQMMGEAASDNKEALESIGIQVGKNGNLSIDKEKFGAAETEEIEKVLGSSGSFMRKASFLAGRIASNAKANVDSISTTYNASGISYAALASRYDIRR